MPSTAGSPFDPFLARQGVAILDGGLATTLEAAGHDLSDPLWSARLLLDDPTAIRRVHRAFLEAGADCIVTASYQASVEGLRRHGLSHDEVGTVLKNSVDLAIAERDAFWARRPQGRLRPLVAASVGPYGAARADGSEYTGDYGLDRDDLYAFHATRWQILVRAGADLLACETIPSAPEAEVLGRLLRETPGVQAWLSFSCRDGEHLSDGTQLVEVVSACADEPGWVAIGINCTAPRHLESLLAHAARTTDKPLIAYPNSGEAWDARRHGWSAGPEIDWSVVPRVWRDRGARILGGCCRVGPERIAQLRAALLPAS